LLKPKKSLGQNFLIDKNISNKIINLVNSYNKKNIIEIGPGKGALTNIIINKNPLSLTLIEKDNDLYNNLLIEYKKHKSVKIYNKDVLNFDFSKIPKPKIIIGNLPYNISIKLIINLLKNIHEYEEIIIMIQKEVAIKMNYKNTKKMNRLNILTSLFCDYKIEFHISKNVFFPKPKVNSSIVRLVPKEKNEYDFKKIENFTKMLFRYKRKKIINVISKEQLKFIKKNKYNDIEKKLDMRAEDLTLSEIIYFFKILC
tara:strand:- start:290 stop:1057 length:768 start_codon:yes stop_codon:yes gene_type:complete